jgi:peptidyl-prolyl cis-trans isomerase C
MNQPRTFSVFLMLGFLCSSVAAQDASKILVTVDKTQITEGDLQFLFVSRRVPKSQQAAVRERFIDYLIERSLLRQFLKGKVTVSDELIDRHVARIQGLVKREGRTMNDVLKAMGYTVETFRAEIAGPLAWDRYARLAIADADIKKYWDTNRNKYDGTEVVAAQIVKRIPKAATKQDIEAIKSKLADLRQSITTSAVSFGDAAKEHSDSPTATKGGSLGTFPFSGRMPQEISRVAFKLKEGEVSEPFQTRFGLHLLTVTNIEPGILSLEDARKEIIEHLSNEMRTRLIASLRKKATVNYAK